MAVGTSEVASVTIRGVALSTFFFNDPAPPDIYPLPLPGALPISPPSPDARGSPTAPGPRAGRRSSRTRRPRARDRKSTRLNSSHSQISYAVFCLNRTSNRANEPSRDRYHQRLRSAEQRQSPDVHG